MFGIILELCLMPKFSQLLNILLTKASVWDGVGHPGRPVPSRWDTGTGWAAMTKASGWDGVGQAGETHTIPVGHCDGMGS